MRILGIETSCDETAAAVVEMHQDGSGAKLLSNIVLTSMDLHAVYGGVVPEIAARSHIESIIPVIDQALHNAFDSYRLSVISGQSAADPQKTENRKQKTQSDPWDQIDGIAVTYGAGLGGSLLVGVMTARTLAITKNKPLYAINHVEGHIYANFITEAAPSLNGQRSMINDLKTSNLTPITYNLPAKQPGFPMLGLIVSGGHSQLVIWRGHFDYTLLGQTQDDAIGEAFDKVAKMLGLPYPGGPSIARKALEGNPHAFNFPKAKITTISPALAELRSKKEKKPNPTPNNNGYDFSFSGLKTAVLRAAQQKIGEDHRFPSFELSKRLSEAQKADIAASFQRIAVETVVDKTVLAFKEFKPASVVIGGGVASSQELRQQLAERLPVPIEYTDPKLCTDNGAMIASLGCHHALLGQPTADPYTLDIKPNLSM